MTKTAPNFVSCVATRPLLMGDSASVHAWLVNDQRAFAKTSNRRNGQA